MKVRELKVMYSNVFVVVPDLSFRSPSMVYEAYRDQVDQLPDEHMMVLLLNAKNQLIGYEDISHGTLTSSLCHPRNVFRLAILKNAAAIILIHNHPSGNPTPSEDDLQLTRRLAQAGELMGIQILDHVIIGANGGGFVSLKEWGHV